MTTQATAPSRRTRGKRAGLDLEQILQAARSLDANSLSMQSVADTLKVDRKALHYHVRDRQALMQLVAKDAFTSGFSGSEIAAATDWRDACRLYAEHLVKGVVSLGPLAEHLWFDESLTTWALEPTEALFQHINAAGFPDEIAVRMVTMLATVCLGHARDLVQARQEAEGRPQSLKLALSGVDNSEFGHLARIVELGVDTYGQEQLQFAVTVILDGAAAALERMHNIRPRVRRPALTLREVPR